MFYVEGSDLFTYLQVYFYFTSSVSDFSFDSVMILAQGWNCTKTSRPKAQLSF